MGNAVIGEYKDRHHNSGNNNEDEGMINRFLLEKQEARRAVAQYPPLS